MKRGFSSFLVANPERQDICSPKIKLNNYEDYNQNKAQTIEERKAHSFQTHLIPAILIKDSCTPC